MERMRTAAVVHLDRLENNLKNVMDRMKDGVELMAVVKGDAYGHGIAGVVPTFQKCGVKRYACAVWEEGMALRQAGCEDEPILILGDTWDDQLQRLIEYRLTPAIFCVETAQKLNALAEKAGVVQPIHIKIDTGMNRIGFAARPESVEPIQEISRLKNLKITGAFTHFARADELDCDSTPKQYEKFLNMIDRLKEVGVDIPFIHTANSPSILLRPEVQLNAVRGGDVLYGLCPVDEDIWPEQGLQEVMTWETYVVMVKTVPAGCEVGYGGTYTTSKETVIATIPIGFADGYDRHLSNKGYVMIHGKKAPIIGRVCMDQFMVDVTEIENVKRGDVVTLLGDGISILEMADMLDQNVDEVVCHISKRVPKVYVER